MTMRILRRNDGWIGGAPHADGRFISGFLLSIRSLVVTHGTALGETLVSAEDLFQGDAVKLRNSSSNLPIAFDDRGAQGIALLFPDADIGTQMTTAFVATSVVFMSEFGKVLPARILHQIEHCNSDVFALIEECMAPSVEYTLIASTS